MSLIQTVEQMIAAYNAKDFDTMYALISPDLQFAHYNRGFALDRDGLFEALRVFARDLVPDRRILPAERVVEIDNLVVREGYFEGVPQVDIPFAQAGEAMSIRVCSIFRFDDAGLIAEWTDYG